jgi:hypothetical protein
MLRSVDKILQQVVVKPVKLLSKVSWSVEQKAAQTLGIRIAGQPGQVVKGDIGTEQRGILQTIQPQDDGIHYGQDDLGETIIVGRAKILHPLSQTTPELQHSKEFLEKDNSTVMRQTTVITGDFEVSWQIHHVRQFLTKGYELTETVTITKRPISSG